jgi:uncharacterized membrane protein
LQNQKTTAMNQFKKITAILLPIILFIFIPLSAFATGDEKASESEFPMEFIFEWVEVAADIIGIIILFIGFAKGVYMFLLLELDRLRGKKDYEELFSLRNILGTYIIISLDFLIVSDIIHSVISPDTKELINLGIIVVLRTSIGFFLGKELNELRKELKEEAHEAELKENAKH